MSPTLTVLTGASLPPLGFSATEPFDPLRVEPITNVLSANGKPTGGVWLSPLLADHASPRTVWADAADDIRGVTLDTWPVAVRETARVLRIDSHNDFEAVTAAYPPPEFGLPAEVLALTDRLGGRGFDYEQMSRDVDVLWLTARGADETRRPTPGLSTWDVETMLVLSRAALA